jgi:hypothetical protein
MCLIIQGNPKNISKEIIKKAFKQNPDGFGLMYLDNKTNRIITKKFFTKKINKILKVCKEHFKKCDEIGLHFRISTVGITNNQNCHPFQILNQDNDKADCFLMHNSPRLPAPLLSDKFSDTYYFSKNILRPMLVGKIELLNNNEFVETIETISQSECDSRILLLDNYTKSFQFLGKWHSHNGLKYSNSSIIPSNNNYSNHWSSYEKPYASDIKISYRNEFDQTALNSKTGHEIKSQAETEIKNYFEDENNIYQAKDYNSINADDLIGFMDLITATTETKLTNEIKENPEIVAQLILATQMGYDINDSTDLQLFCDETNNLTTTFSDLKPYAVRKAGK